MGKEALTAEEQLTADALLLWFGQQWAPSEDDRMAFLKTAAEVMGYERCSAALNAWDDLDTVLDQRKLEVVLATTPDETDTRQPRSR